MNLPLICLLVIFSQVPAEEQSQNEDSRMSKLLPIFQVVRFPNDVCTGTSRNGTCYTAEECSNKGGTSEGSCASGFGVCCVISLACGGTASNNNSYIVQTSTTEAPASPCLYTICPSSSDICRIRYDFTSLVLASQVLGTNAGASSALQNGATGDCTTDQFAISSPGAFGSPVICGTNTGEHMILDSNGKDCQMVNINVGTSTTTTRSWDIYITQYTCAQEDEAGSPGCLQYYTGTGTHVIKNFGWPTTNTATATAATTTHLSNQNYQICFRRESGYCYICYFPWNAGTAPLSFGLDVSPTAAIAKSSVGSDCTSDYLVIPQGTTTTNAAKSANDYTGLNRYCGRMLNPADDDAGTNTVCSREYPFRIGVVTDSNEKCVDAAGSMGDMCEGDVDPAGIIGFALNVYQVAC